MPFEEEQHLFNQAWDEGLQVVDESQKGLKFHLIVRGWKVLEGLNFDGVRLHTLGGEYYTVVADFWLINPACAAVEDDSILWGSLHQLNQVPVMFLRGLALDANAIMDGYDAR